MDLEARGLVEPRERLPLPDGPASVARLLEATLAEDPGREALVGANARLDYRELDAAAHRAAHALAALGMRPGDRVAAALPDGAELLVAFLGAMHVGAVWVGVDRQASQEDCEHVLADSAAKLFLGDGDGVARVEGMRGELPELRQVLRADPGDAASPWARRLAAAPAEPWTSAPDPFAPATIAYASAGPGRPRGIVHGQHQIVLGARATARAVAPALRHGVLLPLTSLGALVAGPLAAWAAGACCVIPEHHGPERVAGSVRSERIDRLLAPACFHHDLALHSDVKRADLAGLLALEVDGTELPERVGRRLRERFDLELRAVYLTDLAPGPAARADAGAPPGCVGPPLPHLSLRVVDTRGLALPPGQPGEVCLAPASTGALAGAFVPPLGWWNQPAATRAALEDGAVRTGDFGALDASGALLLKGRLRDVIQRGGAQVHPSDVERVLGEDPRVAACAVAALPEAGRARRVVAFVRLEPSAHADADQLETLCAARLAHYQVPDEFRFVGALPRDACGRIRRRDLPQLLGDARPR